MEIKTLSLENVEAVEQLAKSLSAREAKDSDPQLVEMLSWSAPWRKESLTHYLANGWSLAGYENGRLVGYILCQPLLYFTSLTQTLWVEDVAAENETQVRELIDVAYQWAKTKHLQRVYFSENIQLDSLGLVVSTMTISYKNSTKMS